MRARCLYSIAAAACTPLFADAATFPVACTGTGTPLQAAVDAAQPGDIIAVSGNCSENALVRNEERRVRTDRGDHLLNGNLGAKNVTQGRLDLSS